MRARAMSRRSRRSFTKCSAARSRRCVLRGAGGPTMRYTPLSTLSEEGNEVLKRALDPARSFASAQDFSDALGRLDGLQVTRREIEAARASRAPASPPRSAPMPPARRSGPRPPRPRPSSRRSRAKRRSALIGGLRGGAHRRLHWRRSFSCKSRKRRRRGCVGVPTPSSVDRRMPRHTAAPDAAATDPPPFDATPGDTAARRHRPPPPTRQELLQCRGQRGAGARGQGQLGKVAERLAARRARITRNSPSGETTSKLCSTTSASGRARSRRRSSGKCAR